jgi:hypothetical protein
MRQAFLGALVMFLLLTGTASAQNRIPYGTVVVDSAGQLWAVMNGERYHVPTWPLDSSGVDALPTSDQWVTTNPNGCLVTGGRPEWLP